MMTIFAVLFREGQKQRRDRLRVSGIEIAGRLVGENQGRIVGNRQCDGDALLLAAAAFFFAPSLYEIVQPSTISPRAGVARGS